MSDFGCFRKGYADTEIEALFAKYDTDGDRILDPEEQKYLAEDLLKQKDSLNAEYAKIQKDAEEGERPAALADLMVRSNLILPNISVRDEKHKLNGEIGNCTHTNKDVHIISV